MKRFNIHTHSDIHGKPMGMRITKKDDFVSDVRKIAEKDRNPFVLLCYEGQKRSTKFNRFYFGVIVQRLSQLIGEHPDRVHDMIKAEILGEEVYRGFDGKQRGRPKRTRNMSSEDFRAFVDAAEVLAVEMGVDLTDIQESTRQLV